ncbi:DoxX family protein [Crocosphaera chwakensis]|uniref:DoxX n=1 Tax=Crocosphaera chwakensis CCY0110 TaxID=391612 RepID=A3IH77_9CHRO|nr:DoxX family protein [Crocosphaera chwakensis]EAZ94319.1 DoxX [Crocosphaera chwakensis CCY0110]
MLDQSNFQSNVSLLGRIFLSAIFIKSGVSKLLSPAQTQAYMASKGIPLTEVLLWATILVLIVGGLSVLLGYKSKIGACLLIGFLIPATVIFHGTFPEEEIAFFKNLGLMGGLLMILAFGSGKFSLEHYLKS